MTALLAVTSTTVVQAQGDPTRGRGIALSPERGNCSICHHLPGGDPATSGTVGPPLAGTGSRHDAQWLRLRLVDGRSINPETIMPAYHRVDGLTNVAAQFRGQPLLTAQEIDDVVAYLTTLRDDR
jgi:sulfur-oxidizing protein SoxX